MSCNWYSLPEHSKHKLLRGLTHDQEQGSWHQYVCLKGCVLAHTQKRRQQVHTHVYECDMWEQHTSRRRVPDKLIGLVQALQMTKTEFIWAKLAIVSFQIRQASFAAVQQAFLTQIAVDVLLKYHLDCYCSIAGLSCFCCLYSQLLCLVALRPGPPHLPWQHQAWLWLLLPSEKSLTTIFAKTSTSPILA